MARPQQSPEPLYTLGALRELAERGVRQLSQLEGKVCVVAGAAGDLGSVAALGLAVAGADVVLASRRLERCEALADAVRNVGRRALACQLDVTDLASIDALFERVVAELGRVDVLVNSMGTNVRKPAEEVTEADWDRVIDTNLKGAFFCARRAFHLMKPRGRGRIVNVASVAGQAARPWPTTSIYGTSKAGLMHLTRYLAAEWAPYGITVNTLAPGYLRTTLTQPLWSRPADLERALQLNVLPRFGELDEVVGPLVFLASDASSYMTGHALMVDGGRAII